jgi:hypothetical protein
MKKLSNCGDKPLQQKRVWPIVIAAIVVSSFGIFRSHAEVCTTQSQMSQADKDAIVSTVRKLAELVQANDTSGVRAQTVPEFAKDFAAMASLVGTTSARLQGAKFTVDQVYLLDANNLKTLADGTNQDAQFFCTLNKSMFETEFLVPSLPPGKYGFAIVTAQGAKVPWEMSFLLRQDPGAGVIHWSMAGFYPKALDAAGHDGLWYWTHARDLVKAKQPWSAYLYYQQAQTLLQPVSFLSSPHLDKLRKEAAAAAPPALSGGISVDVPLVVKGPTGAEYRFTDLTTDDSLGADKIDVLVHLQADPAPEPPAAVSSSRPGTTKSAPPPLTQRDRNSNAMAALVAAFPELRANFHGVWVFADAPGKSPFVSEEPMANIH